MWSFEYAIAVPYFTSVLGFSAEIGNLMWVAGPISGLFVGPVVGALSDVAGHFLDAVVHLFLAGFALHCSVRYYLLERHTSVERTARS